MNISDVDFLVFGQNYFMLRSCRLAPFDLHMPDLSSSAHTEAEFIRFHSAPSGATKRIHTTLPPTSAVLLPGTYKHTLMCKIGGIAFKGP